MDPFRFTTIAHGAMRHCNPLDPAALGRLLAAAGLAPGERLLDAGCGKGELLILAAERHGARGLGLDLNAAFLAEGRAEARRRGVAARVTLRRADAARFTAPPGTFAAAACIGATHAFGGYRPALRALAPLVRPGGHLLVGEGYWRRPPEEGYLAALEARPDDYTDHEGNLAAAAAAGLPARDAAVAGADDWDRYEDLYAATVERHLAEHPDDPDGPRMRDRIRRWRDAYLRWGRDTLGFGIYLLARPAAPGPG